jgi:hypothetical protein
MNQHERDRLAMTERSICEGEKQIAHLSETIRELERKGNAFAAARAKKLLEDFQYDLNLARADLCSFRADTQSHKKRAS